MSSVKGIGFHENDRFPLEQERTVNTHRVNEHRREFVVFYVDDFSSRCQLYRLRVSIIIKPTNFFYNQISIQSWLILLTRSNMYR